jgi:hypothetical protein
MYRVNTIVLFSARKFLNSEKPAQGLSEFVMRYK